jgi:hypothetical protein
MKKWFGLMAIALLAIALPVIAGENDKTVELTGYITDAWCGKANANAEGAACAKACAKKGSELAIYSNGKLYKLEDKELAMKNIGFEVVIKGTLIDEDTVKISSIAKAEPKS